MTSCHVTSRQCFSRRWHQRSHASTRNTCPADCIFIMRKYGGAICILAFAEGHGPKSNAQFLFVWFCNRQWCLGGGAHRHKPDYWRTMFSLPPSPQGDTAGPAVFFFLWCCLLRTQMAPAHKVTAESLSSVLTARSLGECYTVMSLCWDSRTTVLELVFTVHE
jgi:hypothetical protein